MPLQKQSLPINFQNGLDTKTDPLQVSPGKFLELENTVFTKAGLLQKRNGFQQLTSLPNTNYQYLTTFQGNLTAIGTNVAALNESSQSWVTKGTYVPLKLSTQALLRSSSNQAQADSVVSSGGLVCTVYTNSSPSTTYNYVISDAATGQNVVAPTAISGASEPPRVFLLGNYFLILFSQSTNLKYIAIPIAQPSSPGTATTWVTNYLAAGTQLAFDGVVFNNNLYVAYNANDGAGAIRMTYMNSFLVLQTGSTGTNVANTKSASMIAVCADATNSIIWVSYYKTAGTTGAVLAVDAQLTVQLAATTIIAAGTILNITNTATGGVVSTFYEVSNTYSWSGATNYIAVRTTTLAGVLGTATTVLRSVGLASKAFLVNGISYMLTAYSSTYQPSYFLINGSGKLVGKLAYSNGGGYLTLGLPGVSINGDVISIPYLIKDLIVATNKANAPTSSLPVFTQTGVNLASFDFENADVVSTDVGANLQLSGGMLWAYDGYQLTEQGFLVYPENLNVTTSGAGGSIAAADYYYVALYEWTDLQGNIHRSAPSIPVKITTTGATSTNTIKVPTLRLTQKVDTPAKIVLYRYSAANPIYYQVTSLTSPTLNDTTTDSVTITDTQADASIVGNSILYTTGGVVENASGPATQILSLFKSRFFAVDAEDPNTLWYSKQVIAGTPVEMSDLFTLYVAPTVSAQGNTGPITALSALDDKLIIFKKNAIYYLAGTGPDNTGTSNDFTEPVFVTSTVGCDNPSSIVFVPQGLLFQSDKGIWLLGRDLSTSYIGAPVEDFNDSEVLSAVTVPGTNQVRFTLETGEVLMYDYFFGQWGTFSGLSHVSATLYEDLHTFVNQYGQVFQELEGSYLDGSRPVCINLLTSWFNLAGLQGFQRIYYFYLLASYYSPHKITCEIAYDYNASAVQSAVIEPDNYSGTYGSDAVYGNGVYGGISQVERWKVFTNQQKCQAFQIRIRESYDASIGGSAGAGFTLSGLDLVVGLKKGYRPQPSKYSIS
jgi:hypothetical protein